MTFLSDDDREERLRHVDASRPPTRDEMVQRSRERALEALPNAIMTVHTGYRQGATGITISRNEDPRKFDATVVAHELMRLIKEKTGFSSVFNAAESSPARSSFTVDLTQEPKSAGGQTHDPATTPSHEIGPHTDSHDPATCAECRETKRKDRSDLIGRVVRWAGICLAAIIAIGMILFGKELSDEGSISEETGELLVFGGIGLALVLVVIIVLVLSADD